MIESRTDNPNESQVQTSLDSLGCMAEYFRTAWDYVKETFLCTIDWISDRVCCYSNEEPEEPIQRHNGQKAAYKQVVVSPAKSTFKVMESPVVQSTTGQVHVQANQTLPIATPPPLPPTQIANSPSVHQNVERPLNLPSDQTRQLPPMAVKPQQVRSHEGRDQLMAEPPKIDFIETGSIFGDRKRPSMDLNMLQLENGRFRSPGQPRTIPGPGGRLIRVSFMTGFPTIKSVDSSKSIQTLLSKGGSRRSIENQDKNPFDLERVGRVSVSKSLKSSKSMKSVSS